MRYPGAVREDLGRTAPHLEPPRAQGRAGAPLEVAGSAVPEVDEVQAIVQLAQVAQLSELPDGEAGTREVLARLAVLVRCAVPVSDWCSIVLGAPLQPQHVAADSPLAQRADGAQHRSGQGPTLDAHAHRLPVLTDDVVADPRWPRLAGAAIGVPVRAAVAVPLMLDALPNATLNGEVAGVLTLYSGRRAAFSNADDLDRALTVSTVAGAAVAAHRRKEALHSTAEHLRIAMSSRAPIEQAKGLVAGWLGCGVEDAFAVMTGLSQDRNVKVRDLAVLLVADPASPHLRGVLAAGYAKLQQRRAAAAGQDAHAGGRAGDRRSDGRPAHR